jgi:hypothetical protein
MLRAMHRADAVRVEELLQPVEVLDVTAAPPASRHVQGLETRLLLYGILSRLNLAAHGQRARHRVCRSQPDPLAISGTPNGFAQAAQKTHAGVRGHFHAILVPLPAWTDNHGQGQRPLQTRGPARAYVTIS